MNISELFQFDSVEAVCDPGVNNGAPVPCLRTGKITDPQLSAWLNSHFISVGEYLRQQASILIEGGEGGDAA